MEPAATAFIIIGIICVALVGIRILIGFCKVIGAGYHAF
jgi:hypothetical protein